MRKPFVNAKTSEAFNSNITGQYWSAQIGFSNREPNVLCLRLPPIKGLRPRGRTLTFPATPKGMLQIFEALKAHKREAREALGPSHADILKHVGLYPKE